MFYFISDWWKQLLHRKRAYKVFVFCVWTDTFIYSWIAEWVKKETWHWISKFCYWDAPVPETKSSRLEQASGSQKCSEQRTYPLKMPASTGSKPCHITRWSQMALFHVWLKSHISQRAKKVMLYLKCQLVPDLSLVTSWDRLKWLFYFCDTSHRTYECLLRECSILCIS